MPDTRKCPVSGCPAQDGPYSGSPTCMLPYGGSAEAFRASIRGCLFGCDQSPRFAAAPTPPDDQVLVPKADLLELLDGPPSGDADTIERRNALRRRIRALLSTGNRGDIGR